MAKILSDKSRVIREALAAHPEMGNTALAEWINSAEARKNDFILVKPDDISQQKVAMKKAGLKVSASKRGRKPGQAPVETPVTEAVLPPSPVAQAQAGPVELIDKVFALAGDCGGLEQLKRLVDRLAKVQGQ